MTAEERLIFIVSSLILVVLVGGFTVIQLLHAGKAECIQAVQKQVVIDEKKASDTENHWQQVLDDARLNHDAEITAIRAATLEPIPVSVRQYTLNTGVSQNPATPGSRSASGAAVVCPDVLPESPEILRRDFAEAQRADTLTANYRELYNSWPQLSLAPAPR